MLKLANDTGGKPFTPLERFVMELFRTITNRAVFSTYFFLTVTFQHIAQKRTHSHSGAGDDN
jgi:hypothetical protein